MLHCPPKLARTIAYSGFVLASALVPALAADPTGDWRVADGVAHVRIAQCNGNMWGAVAWEKTPGGKDKHNPDPAKQSRPTLGMPILIDMKKKAGTDAWEGQVYNAKDGQLYSSTIKPIGSDKLEIQGCVLGFLCDGETWTRVGPPIPASATNSMAKGTAPKGAPPSTSQAAPQTPKTTGSASPAPAAPAPSSKQQSGQKQAATSQSGDVVGDICLLPDVARFTH
ncbi:DUF2147 domain-containing protein [Bradyrhizobium cenepequi]|uniref:DUF2147 domain-containing protein n=1 Tax=Bradyrhizobium cenepequi TaxID=2821403 RepID=UPI001CE2F850|nr:DUF2147 domain-containing protein [Bradyrhizobium cenepequi]MCA6110171.1 DUF2147 domain-containing protein [Bradyrhizobium cenepequi]